MPSASFGRRRERASPKPLNFIPCGVLLKKSIATGAVVSKIPFKPAAWPYELNEVTWDTKHLGPPYVTGGNFASLKAHSDANVIKGYGIRRSPIQEGWYYWEYNGGFIRPTTSQDTSTMSSALNLFVADPWTSGHLESQEALGPMAFDKLRPRLQQLDLGVSLGESLEIGRMLRTSSSFFKNRWEEMGGRRGTLSMSSTRKEVSSHFLNHTFGWTPFVSDLSKVLETLKHQMALMRQISRDNGNWIKRARTLSKTDVVTAERSGYAGGLPWRNEFDLMCNNIVPNLYSPYQWRQVDTIRQSTWAVGQFSYYRPEFDLNRMEYLSAFDKVQRVLTLYGLRVNPSTLWEITPWSWLVDWFTGFGTWLKRIVDIGSDGIAAKYLYIMRKVEKTTRHSVFVNWIDGPQSLNWSNSLDSKQREEANNPFGFTLPGGGLSPKQLAIMAALGLSR